MSAPEQGSRPVPDPAVADGASAGDEPLTQQGHQDAGAAASTGERSAAETDEHLARTEPARHVGGAGAGSVEEGEVRECPRCHATNLGEAAFCEGCGMDLVTGVEPPEPGEEELPPTRLQASSPYEVYAEPARDADDIAIPPQPGELELDPQDIEARPQVPPPTPPSDAVPAHEQPEEEAPSTREDDRWVVELWVDAAWHASRDAGQPCPEMGVPDVIPINSQTVLIGRTSVPQDLHPDIDCGNDAGVSVRHAQLTSDGHRWWVEDLDTSNGTYVGTVGQELPTEPIAQGTRVQVDSADRIWLGSWTCLVVRPAPPQGD